VNTAHAAIFTSSQAVDDAKFVCEIVSRPIDLASQARNLLFIASQPQIEAISPRLSPARGRVTCKKVVKGV
jgi:hypothetical protein